MKWAQSLIRVANHRVEDLQKRLGEIVARRLQAEMKRVMLNAEAEAERQGADQDAQSGLYHIGFMHGWRLRRDQLEAQLAEIGAEEAGARDALAQAFEELKKFEKVAETARVAAVKEELRKESAELDEMGRRQGGRTG